VNSSLWYIFFCRICLGLHWILPRTLRKPELCAAAFFLPWIASVKLLPFGHEVMGSSPESSLKEWIGRPEEGGGELNGSQIKILRLEFDLCPKSNLTCFSFNLAKTI
jgi:hypothetical protein